MRLLLIIKYAEGASKRRVAEWDIFRHLIVTLVFSLIHPMTIDNQQ